MITEIILVIFAIVYYLFSVFFVGSIIEEPEAPTKKYIAQIIFIIFCSPIAAPIILGIEIGQAIKEK